MAMVAILPLVNPTLPHIGFRDAADQAPFGQSDASVTQPGCSPLAGQISARKAAERQHYGTFARQGWASKT